MFLQCLCLVLPSILLASDGQATVKVRQFYYPTAVEAVRQTVFSPSQAAAPADFIAVSASLLRPLVPCAYRRRSHLPPRRPCLLVPAARRSSRWPAAAAAVPAGASRPPFPRPPPRLSSRSRSPASSAPRPPSGVSHKAVASQEQSTRLWPRAVLEALDSADASCHWESALEIFELLRKQRWYEPRSQTYARLLMMLGKCRQPGPATALFKVMLSERLRSTADVYTALVGAYGYSGLLNKALATIDQMKGAADCKPDEYTFSVLINCCGKLRRFDRIPAILDEMSYLELECNAVIHNAIIDGYGKAGMLEEMENALSNMLEANRTSTD